jgi:hypothetical protein
MTQPNQPVRVRPSVLDLTAAQMGQYVLAVKKLKTTDAPGGDPSIPAAAVTSKISVYDWYVQVHEEAMKHAVHSSPWFLPWHRQFILDFENALRLVGGYPAGLGLPYWDWAGDPPNAREKNSAVWAVNFMGGDGEQPAQGQSQAADFAGDVKTGPFQAGPQWKLTITEGTPPAGTTPGTNNLRRGMGRNPVAPTLPTQPQVNDVLKRPAYDSDPWNQDSPYATSFRNALEGWATPAGLFNPPAVLPEMHNRAHVWVGGSMIPSSSPNDPVFFLHHANIDRIWAQWQDNNPGQHYAPQLTPPDELQTPGENKPPRPRIGGDDPMWPWTETGKTVTPNGVWNYKSLGYLYGTGYVIDQMAGNGTEGSSGDGGPASSAQLGYPWAVAATADGGGFLIADAINLAVRKVSLTGYITRVAGNGTKGSGGDGGPATSAQLGGPGGVAATADGGFLIADPINQTVRKVSAAGIITRVAGTGIQGNSGDGGPATSAQLNNPCAVAVTADGGFLIGDLGNAEVRKVSAAGIITRVAGTGAAGAASRDGGPATSAQLMTPWGVAATPDGGFLVCDGYSVRKVSKAGIITRVAGNDTQGSSGDGGPATSAQLGHPMGVAATPDGGFLIADSGNQTVRKVSKDGYITRVAGTGEQGNSAAWSGRALAAPLNNPSGVAVFLSGFLIADVGNCAVRWAWDPTNPT